MSREVGADEDRAPAKVTYARLIVLAPGSRRATRRGILAVTGLVVLAVIKPWGGVGPTEDAPSVPQARTPAPLAARQPDSPISSICHESHSWRIATEGSFIGNQLREWGFVDPVAADGPSDPSIPFVIFSFTRLRVLGYCAPAHAQPPSDVEVLVFRLDDTGSSTSVAVQREARTPASSVAGLFSIAPPASSTPRASAPLVSAASWPAGRYVFALHGDQLGDIWFGADVRPMTGGGDL